MKRRICVVVMGILGRTPLAGVSWQVLQYLEGFRRLGFDLHYIEDTGDWAYNPDQTTNVFDREQYAINCAYAVDHVSRVLSWFGMKDSWAYCSRIDGRYFGLTDTQVRKVLERAEVLVNVTGSNWLFEEHLRIPIRVYLETDPVIRQIEVAKGDRDAIEQLSAHTHHYTYGENLGAPDCGVPITPFDYRPTRPPIILDWWANDESSSMALKSASTVYTTIGNWAQGGKDVEWNGDRYLWSKHVEFLKFIDLPRRTTGQFELALLCKTEDDAQAIPLLRSHGWLVRDALTVSREILPYREYIAGSRGEFTVAKDQNIRLRSGWFSDRSACYLAAGRPVVTQDTAFDTVLPVGEGLFAFRTMDDIVAAIDAIESDYYHHSKAARELAADCFAAERVLGRMVEDWGI